MSRMMIGLGLMALAMAAQAGPVDVPNSFQGGARALASEVNANFAAVEAAVDDNAARIQTLESGLETANTLIDENSAGVEENALAISDQGDSIAALQAGFSGAGVLVRVGGVLAGRYVSHGNEPITVEVAGSGGTETEAVARRTVLGTADVVTLISTTGYFFALSTTDFPDLPFGGEGTLAPLVLWYATADCTGQAYLAVEGPAGLFSTFDPGVGDTLPIKRWLVRQGFAFRSPDPAAVGEAYMVPRGQSAQQVALNSLYRWSGILSAPSCLDLSVIPGHVGNEINSVVLVQPLDSLETGIAADMAGEITIDW